MGKGRQFIESAGKAVRRKELYDLLIFLDV